MKRIQILSIIACGASLAVCPVLRAQDASPAPSVSGTEAGTGFHKGHHGGGPLSLERLTTELSLTPDQQTKIKPILDTLHSTMQGLHQNAALAPEDRKSQAKQARDTAFSQINAVLTPDQQTKFAALQQQMHNWHHGGPEGQSSPTGAAPQ